MSLAQSKFSIAVWSAETFLKPPEAYKPHTYQKRGIKFLVERMCAGLLLDPGLGKTSITLAAFKVLRQQNMVKRMLVIAPRRPAYRVWPEEVAKWKDFEDFSINVLHGKNKDALFDQQADIDVVTLEGLEWLMRRAKKFKTWPWDMLVIDESSKFKNTATQRFKNLKPHLKRFKRRVILTGSPASNGLLNLFGQVYILDLGNALGAYITHYRNSYFDKSGFGGFDWKIRGGADKKIYNVVRPLVLRMAAEDHLDLPKLSYHNIEVDLPEKARAAYDELEEELIAQLDGNKITAFNAGTLSGKCRQMANGGVYVEGKKWIHVHDAKTEALEDLIDELNGKPMLVAYEFAHDLERLRKLLGKNVPYIGGGLSDAKQAIVERLWNARKIPVLPVQPASAAHGLNLQGTDAYVVFYSMLWDLENYEQLIRRVWRQGQKNAVRVYHIMARDTVDYAQLASLGRKDKTQKTLLNALKTYARSRK